MVKSTIYTRLEIQSEVKNELETQLGFAVKNVSLLLDAYLKLLINLQRWNLKKRLGLTMNIFIP